MNQQRGAKLVNSFFEFFTAALFVRVREEAPLGPGSIEREIYELSGKFCFLYLDLREGGCEAKGTACGITWILIATHCFTSVWIET